MGENWGKGHWISNSRAHKLNQKCAIRQKTTKQIESPDTISLPLNIYFGKLRQQRKCVV